MPLCRRRAFRLGARAAMLVLLAGGATCTRAHGRGDGASSAPAAPAGPGDRPPASSTATSSSSAAAGGAPAAPGSPVALVRGPTAGEDAPTAAATAHPRFPAIDVHMHIVPGGI